MKKETQGKANFPDLLTKKVTCKRNYNPNTAKEIYQRSNDFTLNHQSFSFNLF